MPRYTEKIIQDEEKKKQEKLKEWLEFDKPKWSITEKKESENILKKIKKKFLKLIKNKKIGVD